jgi:hypothetical protein
MRGERAYTHIDRVRVVLGNAWLEREWSTMIGNTTSLFQKQGEVEWLAADSMETRIVLGGEDLGLLDLGAPDWSEEQTPFGALVRARYAGPRIGLTLWTMALHEQPALLRGGELHVGLGGAVALDGMSVDELPVTQAVCEEDRVTPSEYPWADGAGAVAIRRPGKCMVAAYQAPIEARLLEQPSARYRFEMTTPRLLPPGERLPLPELLLLVGRGEAAHILGAAYPAAVRLAREYKLWQQERLREH